MGFGYLFLGYVIEYVLELNAYGALLYLPGYALIYLGLSNLQMYCHSFRYAKWLTLPLAVLAAYRTLEGAGRLFFFSVPIVTEQISRVVSLANMFLVLAFHVMLGLAIKDIALKTGVKRIAATALRNTVFAALYFCVAIPVSFMSSVDSILYGSLLILRLLWAILNSVLLYTCYMRICPAEEVQREATPKPSRIGFVNKFREEFQKREDRAIAADREYHAENTRRRMEKKRSKAVLQAGTKAAKREEVKAAREAAKKRRDL